MLSTTAKIAKLGVNPLQVVTAPLTWDPTDAPRPSERVGQMTQVLSQQGNSGPGLYDGLNPR
jgi:hypothetical protein